MTFKIAYNQPTAFFWQDVDSTIATVKSDFDPLFLNFVEIDKPTKPLSNLDRVWIFQEQNGITAVSYSLDESDRLFQLLIHTHKELEHPPLGMAITKTEASQQWDLIAYSNQLDAMTRSYSQHWLGEKTIEDSMAPDFPLRAQDMNEQRILEFLEENGLDVAMSSASTRNARYFLVTNREPTLEEWEEYYSRMGN